MVPIKGVGKPTPTAPESKGTSESVNRIIENSYTL